MDSLIETNPLAQDGKDEGVDTQVVKIVDIIKFSNHKSRFKPFGNYFWHVCTFFNSIKEYIFF